MTYLDFVESIDTTVLQGEFAKRFVGLIDGLNADIIAQGSTEAVKAPWLAESTNPNDSLPLIAAGRNLDLYPIESIAQRRARLLRAWTDWQAAGDETAIEGQLAAVGFAGTNVYTPGPSGPDGWEREPLGYWSQFWLFFPAGTHPVTAAGPVCGGGGTAGSGLLCGPVGITFDQLATIRAILRKWKPSDWICREIIFEIAGPICGADGTSGGGAVCGAGSQAIVGP